MIPYGGYCPVEFGEPVRLKSFATRKSMDYDHSEGRGSRSLHQFDTINHGNQKWTIEHAGPFGFRIRHYDSGRYLTTGNVGDGGRVFMVVGDFGSVFTFEPLSDGTVYIHLAGQNQYTMNPEGGGLANGVKLIMWPHGAADNDKWYVRAHNDLS
ncbi:hypothetical protein BDW22DRAFT_601839 [Trametopsis cervina]|nr:hypothetical protein BDW22DRAFT_601839 [Trametopsis cervina]